MILVTGGTGFVGRHLVARLVSEGEQVRVLARYPTEIHGRPHPLAPSPSPSGSRWDLTGSQRDPERGRVELVAGDVTDPSSLGDAFNGCAAVIHLVGIIRETRGRSFHRVHVEGTRNVIETCRRAGIHRLVHMSALGTRERAVARYHHSKWEAEQLVRASGLAAVIFRPSVIFGEDGAYLPTIRSLVTVPPVIPIVGDGMSLVQPIWVEDVVSCFTQAMHRNDTAGHTYELGGPESYGFEQLIDLIAEAAGISKPKIHLPVWMMRPVVTVLSRVSARFPLTSDQLTMLLEDNWCDIEEMRQTFEIEPASLRGHLQKALPTDEPA